MRLLFTNIGRRTYFVDFVDELRRQGIDIELFVSDATKDTAGFWAAEGVQSFLMPRVLDDPREYITRLLEKCRELQIDVLIPLMDFELWPLAVNKEYFLRNGTRVIVSDENVVKKCMDKKVNYEFCLAKGIPVPHSFFGTDEPHGCEWLVKKRIEGSGSVGMQKIHISQWNILREQSFSTKDDMLQEFVEGEEHGMNILNDLNGNFVHAVCCKKLLMRAGETDKGVVVYSEPLEEWARKISAVFRHIGNLDVDLIMTSKGPYFIDFNPRFGGLYPAAHLSGQDYLRYLLCMVRNEPFQVSKTRAKTVFMKGISLYSYEACP